MRRYLFALLLTGLIAPAAPAQDRRAQSLLVLRGAVERSGNFLVRMHAAEALISNGYTNDIAPCFPLRRGQPSIQTTGSARVLARLGQKKAMVPRIMEQFLMGDTLRNRLTALESLAKLGFSKPLLPITAQADTGRGGFKAMALWVLSNNGAAEGEERLAALLPSRIPTESFYAAYALRFKKKIGPATYRLLDSCATAGGAADPGRVLVLSSFYVHAVPQHVGRARAALLHCLNGAAGDRYQVGEGLAIRGTPDDLPVLDRLLADEDEDVRVSAANAILHITTRNKK
jgi:HEAT repeat protein